MRIRMATALALVALSLSGGVAQAQSWSLGKWDPGIHNVKNGIYYSFCGHKYVYCSLGSEAWNVAACETGGTFSVWARNGQYHGLFQMGSSERSRYGQGHNPWVQARAAKRYYDDAGWYPWQCTPWGYLRW